MGMVLYPAQAPFRPNVITPFDTFLSSTTYHSPRKITGSMRGCRSHPSNCLPRIISHHREPKPIGLVELLNKSINLHASFYFDVHVFLL